MKRLTKLEKQGDYIFVDGPNVCPNELATKIGEFEDMEEELKIDVLKMLQHVFVFKVSQVYLKDAGYRVFFIKYGYFFTKVKGKTYVLPFEDYGKYWAFTEEELEG